ncbi:MAG: glycogen debranching protein [Calditrichaceae bacterium]
MQSKIYESGKFEITQSKVVQGQYHALAINPNNIISTYQSDYKPHTKRELFFKFSLNGGDNERFPGEDHRIILDDKNPEMTSEIYIFGENDPEQVIHSKVTGSPDLNNAVAITIRCDMNNVLKAFETNGFYITKTGERITREHFNGVYIAGAQLPLTWEFASLNSKDEFRLNDEDGDGIFEITLKFSPTQVDNGNEGEWKLSTDISSLPQYKSGILMMDALYNLSLEELLLDIRDDGAFMAGQKWPGVWTRDISYSILLSLAAIRPDAAKKSLIKKVKNDRIIQDTGTGGSWPVSTDRMTWALAAWEIYKVTGDLDWLKYTFGVIRNSANDDLAAAFNPSTGLFFGESSFLDWREQTYPLWMDPKDIYKSQCLGTNAVHYQTYLILAQMAEALGENGTDYRSRAGMLKNSINKWLWIPEKGYYGQYLYGRTHLTVSPKSETLGEALSIIFEISDKEQQSMIMTNMPLTEFGPTCIFPQISDIPPYHNDGIWPFVSAYWTWAAAEAKNVKAVEHGLASVYRSAALFLTNKENMVAQSGDYLGTEINSDRQLWSVAGNLAMTYRVFFGMRFTPDSLRFNPFIPESYTGLKELQNFPYRSASLNIAISGFGDEIKEIRLDGEKLEQAAISGSLEGQHTVAIIMNGQLADGTKINLVENHTAPQTPVAKIDQNLLTWQPVSPEAEYIILINGRQETITTDTLFRLPDSNECNEYQVKAVDSNGYESFLSEPVTVNMEENTLFAYPMKNQQAGGNEYLELSKTKNLSTELSVQINEPGTYSIDCFYANGNGPINTNNQCAIRTLSIDGIVSGKMVMAQRGTEKWDDWGYSNSILRELGKGKHTITLFYDKTDENMNGEVNTAHLKHIRLVKI